MRIFVLLAGALALAGCAHKPIVDMKGVDQAQYRMDVADCQAYADQVSPGQEAAGGAVGGGLLGAALGAIAGAFGGNMGNSIGFGAATGGTIGAAGGLARGYQGKDQVVRNCLSGRGYSVLR